MYNSRLLLNVGALIATFFVVSTALGQKSLDEALRKVLFSNAKASIDYPTDFEIQRSVPDQKRKLTFHYIRQTFDGLPILNGTAVVVEKQGLFRKTGDRFVYHSTDGYTKTNLQSKAVILDKVWAQLETSKSSEKTTLSKKNGSEVLINSHYSKNEIPVSEGIFFDGASFRRVYEYSIEMKDQTKWLSIYADATSGDILFENNWVVSCAASDCSMEAHLSGTIVKDQKHFLQMAPAPPPSGDAYRVIPIPTISPVHGNFELVTGPSNTTASPYGWHDDNGVDGSEYTITRGNNVFAYDDRNNNDGPGYSPDGGSNLVFDFPITNTNDPDTYLDAAITNLFYMNNIMHDVWYQYGFDEPAGNFQALNYSNTGRDEDAVQAEAQDGSGTNNANFATPTDGNSPRMQMYIWNGSGTSRLITINKPSEYAGDHASGRANFGMPISSTPFTDDLAIAYDSSGNDALDACEPIVGSFPAGKIAYVRKGGCDYDVKAINCENAGASGMMVYNTATGNPINMNVSNPPNISIPLVMIGRSPGLQILEKLKKGDSISVTLYDHGWYGNTDSDLDNLIIAHEYGHGISTRLTGGPANSNCLFNAEQMGEGWSDWFGLMLTIRPEDAPELRRGVGTFVSNESNTGTGIRPRPYSTSFGVNNFTYGSTNSNSLTQPHGIGFVWATMLWDMSWALMDKYGFDPNVYTGDGGNNKAMELVINGLKLQPCQPGFVDGRDAILEANDLIFDGVDECLLWQVFARRGLGANAEQGNSNSRSDQTEDFSLPAFCTAGLSDFEIMESTVRIYPNPANDELTISIDPSTKIQSVNIVDVNGRLIKEISNLSQSTLSVDISNFNSGIYFVQLNSNGQQIIRKIVKN